MGNGKYCPIFMRFLQIYPRKIMDEYRHHVSGFIAHREDAEGAATRLVERGMSIRSLICQRSGRVFALEYHK